MIKSTAHVYCRTTMAHHRWNGSTKPISNESFLRAHCSLAISKRLHTAFGEYMNDATVGILWTVHFGACNHMVNEWLNESYTNSFHLIGWSIVILTFNSFCAGGAHTVDFTKSAKSGHYWWKCEMCSILWLKNCHGIESYFDESWLMTLANHVSWTVDSPSMG